MESIALETGMNLGKLGARVGVKATGECAMKLGEVLVKVAPQIIPAVLVLGSLAFTAYVYKI